MLIKIILLGTCSLKAELFRGATASRLAKDEGEAALYREQVALDSSLNVAGAVIGQADEVRQLQSNIGVRIGLLLGGLLLGGLLLGGLTGALL